MAQGRPEIPTSHHAGLTQSPEIGKRTGGQGAGGADDPEVAQRKDLKGSSFGSPAGSELCH